MWVGFKYLMAESVELFQLLIIVNVTTEVLEQNFVNLIAVKLGFYLFKFAPIGMDVGNIIPYTHP